jgi:hypothetical protein
MVQLERVAGVISGFDPADEVNLQSLLFWIIAVATPLLPLPDGPSTGGSRDRALRRDAQ